MKKTTENDRYLSFSFFNFIFFESIIIICEYIQSINGEKAKNFFIHLIFFTICIILILIYDQQIGNTSKKLILVDFCISLPKIFHLMMISYLFLETGSYILAKHDVDFQVLSSMSFSYMYQEHIDYLIYFILLVLIVILLISIRTNIFMIEFKEKYIFLFSFLLYINIILLYFVLLIAIKSLYPFSNVNLEGHYSLTIFTRFPAFTKLRDDYDSLFQKGPIRNNQKTLFNDQALKYIDFKMNKTYHPKRNLIIIQMESVEKQSVGIFNHFHHNLMPFISNFSQQGTFIEHAVPQPFSLWTSGAIFASYCGLPHVISDQVWGFMSHTSISKWPNLPCISKHFQNVGYNLYFSAGGRMKMMGILQFFQQAGFQVEDSLTTKLSHDIDFYDYMIQKLFKVGSNDESKYKNLLKGFQLKEPFVYILNNEDTHPNFYVDKRCNPDKKAPKIKNSLNCLDHMLELFFKAFEKSDLFDHTDIFMFGDHPSVGMLSYFYKEPRDLLMFFPYLPKRKIQKQVTLYDIAPTLLDMMGIQYYPPFPYGTNMFNEKKIGTFPKEIDFNYIYNKILEKNNKNNQDLKCFQNGNCENKWEYYKTRQFRTR